MKLIQSLAVVASLSYVSTASPIYMKKAMLASTDAAIQPLLVESDTLELATSTESDLLADAAGLDEPATQDPALARRTYDLVELYRMLDELREREKLYKRDSDSDSDSATLDTLESADQDIISLNTFESAEQEAALFKRDIASLNTRESAEQKAALYRREDACAALPALESAEQGEDLFTFLLAEACGD